MQAKLVTQPIHPAANIEIQATHRLIVRCRVEEIRDSTRQSKQEMRTESILTVITTRKMIIDHAHRLQISVDDRAADKLEAALE